MPARFWYAVSIYHGRSVTKEESPTRADTGDFDDAGDRIAMLARKATRKASRVANQDGYFVEPADGTCIVRAPGGKTVTLAAKTTPIDVRKHYAFASETH